jgi:hypothetical protein
MVFACGDASKGEVLVLNFKQRKSLTNLESVNDFL